MKNTWLNLTAGIVLAASIVFTSTAARAADNLNDALEVVRSTYAADRQAFVSEHMPLTEKESGNFWPVYREYKAEREKLGDQLVKTVREYAEVYPDVSKKAAKRILKRYTELDKELQEQRTTYLKKFGKVLPPEKVLRLAQLEHRMDIVLRLQLASTIPMTSGMPPRKK